jgi:hypothetical protein
MEDPVDKQLLCESQRGLQSRSGSVSSSALSTPLASPTLDVSKHRDLVLPKTQRPQALILNRLHSLSTIAEIEQHLYNILVEYSIKADTYWLDV